MDEPGAAFCEGLFQACDHACHAVDQAVAQAVGAFDVECPALKSSQRTCSPAIRAEDSLARVYEIPTTRWYATRIECAPAVLGRAPRRGRGGEPFGTDYNRDTGGRCTVRGVGLRKQSLRRRPRY